MFHPPRTPPGWRFNTLQWRHLAVHHTLHLQYCTYIQKTPERQQIARPSSYLSMRTGKDWAGMCAVSDPAYYTIGGCDITELADKFQISFNFQDWKERLLNTFLLRVLPCNCRCPLPGNYAFSHGSVHLPMLWRQQLECREMEVRAPDFDARQAAS